MYSFVDAKKMIWIVVFNFSITRIREIEYFYFQNKKNTRVCVCVTTL